MTEALIPEPLKAPWLVAVWPGMGQVALNAGFYLAAKLEMAVFAEFSPRELFDVEHVEVQNGIIRPARLPRSRFFLWRDPAQRRDLVLFIGEAQPPAGKRQFCQGLIDISRRLGVERIFTFAAMATQMHPEAASRVFVASTDQATLDEVALLDVQILREGTIGGLNGVLLGEAAEAGLHGTCLLGEMPHLFAQLPFPGGSLAVLKIFRELTGVALDLGELEQQTEELGRRLGELLAQVEGQFKEEENVAGEEEAAEFAAEPEPPPKLSPEEERRIEALFDQARQDRSKAYELKRELDRLHIFADYEDRFLDLFRKGEE
jgi:predicted ATP-grasp superfamily ATP-dependent carboligase